VPMNLSIRTKLFAGFGALLALMLAAILVGSHGMGGIMSVSDDLGYRDAPSLGAAGSIGTDIEQYRLAQATYVLSNDPAMRSASEQTMKAAQADARQALAKARKLSTPADRGAVADMEAATTAYLAGPAANIVPLSRQSKTAEATKLVNDTRAQFLQVRTAVGKYVALMERRADTDNVAAEAAQSDAKRLLVIVGLLSLAIGGAIAFFLSRSISRRSSQSSARPTPSPAATSTKRSRSRAATSWPRPARPSRG
jgi:methyl-accepting chemotaxis protein